MKKHVRRLTAFLLFAVMLTAVLTVAWAPEEVAAERTILDVEKELKECQAMLAEIKSELAKIQSEISSLESKSGQNDKLLESYQTEIEALEAEIAVGSEIEESYDQKRADVAAQIALTESEYDYQKEQYKELMRFIYENSADNTFELLFTSDNLTDYLSRRDDFNDIMNAANDLLRSVKSSISDLEQLRSSYEDTQREYEEYLSDLRRTELDYRSKVDQYETIAQQLGMDVESLKSQYAGKNSRIAELTAKISKLKKEREELYARESDYKWPLKSNVSYRVTSYFGYRSDPFGKPTTEFHKGLDIACSVNSNIIAARGGTVTKAAWYGGYGNCVIIYHGNGVSTLYGHMNKIASGIKEGVVVKQGDLIGYVGTTGRSTGYHLHFGVINTNQHDATGTQYDNPDKYLPDGYYTKKLKTK